MKKTLLKNTAALGISIIMMMVSVSYQGPAAKVQAASPKSASISSANVKKGKVTLRKRTYQNLTIKKSAGKAKIQLNNIKVTGTLTIESGVSCNLSVEKSSISKIAVKAPVSKKKTAVPVIQVKGASKVSSLHAAGNMTLKDNGKVKSLTVSPKAGKSLAISLSGFKGNMTVKNADKASVSIKTSNSISKAVVSGKAKGMKFTVTDTSRKKDAVISNISILAPVTLKLDIAANKVNVDKKAAKISLILNKKTAALNSKAPNASIVVGKGAMVTSMTTEGVGSRITGKGQVRNLTIKGNNTNVAVKVKKVDVAENVTGVVVNGKNITEKDEEKKPEPEKPEPVAKEYKVTFDAGKFPNGDGVIVGTGSNKVERMVKENTVISDIPQADRENWNFLGWGYSVTGTALDLTTFKITEDVTFKAVYDSKLQTCLRCTKDGSALEYNSEMDKMVFAGNTAQEVDSPLEAPKRAGCYLAFYIDNIGADNKASLALYSLNDEEVTIRLTKGADEGGEEISGAAIPKYHMAGKYYTDLPAGDYRITITLNCDPNQVVSRALYISQGAFDESMMK